MSRVERAGGRIETKSLYITAALLPRTIAKKSQCSYLRFTQEEEKNRERRTENRNTKYEIRKQKQKTENRKQKTEK